MVRGGCSRANPGPVIVAGGAVLRGKHKPTFTPWMDNGDFVIILNADKIAVTGNREDAKMYYTSRLRGRPEGNESARLAGQASDARRGTGDQGHAAAQPAGPPDVQEAARIRGRRASARRAEAQEVGILKQSPLVVG